MSNRTINFGNWTQRPIRVHSWGGLGSQLFACLVARRLSGKFPKKRIVVVFHSAGVTYRGIEVGQNLTSSFEVQFIDDFKSQDEEKLHETKRVVVSVRKILLVALERFGFLVRLNDEQDFTSVTSRVLEVRGHYSHIRLDMHEILWISESLGLIGRGGESLGGPSAALHLRLGDLLTLKSKTHISAERVADVLRNFRDLTSLCVYSDSNPEVVLPLLQIISSEISLEVFNTDTVTVMYRCLRARVFIGTNSKISIWIAVLRLSQGLGELTLLPREVASQAREMVNLMNLSQSLIEY